VWGFFR